MNPFVLLIKPMMAVGFLVTKMAVAVGYVATEDGRPPTPPAHEQAEVRVAVLPGDDGIQHMEVEMPNGELFELSEVATERSSSSLGDGPRVRRPRPTVRPAGGNGGSQTVAMLESTLGRSMRCNVSLARDAESGSARCTVDDGEVYQVTF